MALPNPTLTWTQGAYVSTGSTAPSTQQVIDAIDTALVSDPNWTTISKTTDYLEIGPVAESPINSFKALICASPSTGALAPDTSTTDIFIGIAPDGGVLGTYNSATPYGANRFSKYWCCAKTGVVESVYVVSTAETLMIVFRDDSNDNIYMAYIGAILEGTDAGSVEGDDRIYGMAVSGNTEILHTFWGSANEIFAHGTANKQSHFGIFRPTAPATFEPVQRVCTTATIDADVTLSSLGDYKVAIPHWYQHDSSPTYLAGRLRQIYMYSDDTNRQVKADQAAATKGYIFGAVSSGTADAALLGNA